MLACGMFMTSFCTKYSQILLAQGFLMGLGMGCLFTPATSLVAQYFSKRRGLAMGIVTSGSTIGLSTFSSTNCTLINSRGHNLSDHVPPTYRP